MSNANEPHDEPNAGETAEKPETKGDPTWIAIILFGGLAVVLILYVLLKK